MRKVHNWLKAHFGYHVAGAWGRLEVHHYTWSWAEALEWLSMYPEQAVLGVWTGKHCVAMRLQPV